MLRKRQPRRALGMTSTLLSDVLELIGIPLEHRA